jgi:xylulokinase
MRVHSDRIGIGTPTALIATGGGAKNPEILQIIADVFGLEVYVEHQPDAASFGAALRAVQALRSEEHGSFVPFEQACSGAFHRVLAAKPDLQAHRAYTDMLPLYEEAERLLVRRFARE